MKACGSSFPEITEFLTQFQTWHRQSCSSSRAGISFQQQKNWSSLCPSHCCCWNGAGALSKLHWGVNGKQEKTKAAVINPIPVPWAGPLQMCSSRNSWDKTGLVRPVVVSKYPQMHLKYIQVWLYHPQTSGVTPVLIQADLGVQFESLKYLIYNTAVFYNTQFFYNLFVKCIPSKHVRLPRCLKELKCQVYNWSIQPEKSGFVFLNIH